MNPTGPTLRDIHLPAEPSWWPPAPGWWLLAVLLLIAGFFLFRALWRWRQRRQFRQLIERELQHIEQRYPEADQSAEKVAALSVLLRRLARQQSKTAAALTDEAWLHFLDGDDPQRPFSQGIGTRLLTAPYQRQVPQADAEALLALVRQTLPRWVRAYHD